MPDFVVTSSEPVEIDKPRRTARLVAVVNAAAIVATSIAAALVATTVADQRTSRDIGELREASRRDTARLENAIATYTADMCVLINAVDQTPAVADLRRRYRCDQE